MSRGEVQGVFQWIFVIIGGVAMLGMLLFFMRGCAESGERQMQDIGIQGAATRISSMVWQGNTNRNITVQPSEVACEEGNLLLRTERASADLLGLPVFLSPHLSGRLYVKTQRFSFGRDINMGSVLWGADEHTWYVIVKAGGYRSLTIPEGTKTLFINPGDPIELPSTARSAIIITMTDAVDLRNIDLSGLDRVGDVRGVSITDSAGFYRRYSGSLEEVARMPAENNILKTGAAIAGDAGNYRCARESLEQRAMFLASLQEERTQMILLDSALDERCEQPLSLAKDALASVNEKGTLAELMRKEQTISSAQLALMGLGCPVIS